jgi:hypothetical protein
VFLECSLLTRLPYYYISSGLVLEEPNKGADFAYA